MDFSVPAVNFSPPSEFPRETKREFEAIRDVSFLLLESEGEEEPAGREASTRGGDGAGIRAGAAGGRWGRDGGRRGRGPHP